MAEIKLHIVEKGNGFPLILLHGNGESSAYFTKQIDFFATTYRVIAVDTRGHGNSPRGKASFTLEQFAEDLKDLLDTLSITQAHILGFSDGANTALLFALQYPDKISRLILNGADLSPKGVKRTVQIPILIGYYLLSLVSLFDKKAIAKKELLGLMVTQPNILPTELAVLRCPVLVIAGSNDMIKEQHTKLIAASLPNAKLCILPGDHFVASKNSTSFNAAVSAFLNQ